VLRVGLSLRSMLLSSLAQRHEAGMLFTQHFSQWLTAAGLELIAYSCMLTESNLLL